jgi:hypothetical protein
MRAMTRPSSHSHWAPANVKPVTKQTYMAAYSRVPTQSSLLSFAKKGVSGSGLNESSMKSRTGAHTAKIKRLM